MNLSGRYFIYNDIASKQYGLRILNLDTDRIATLATPMSYSATYNRGKKQFYVTGSTYESPLDFEIEFVSDKPLTLLQSRTIKKWLFNKKNPARLYSEIKKDTTRVRMNGVWKRDYMECIFYNPEEIRFADGVHGYKATGLLTSIMAVQEEVEYVFTSFIDSSTSQLLPLTVRVDSDIDDYVYPVMEITMASGSTSNVIITNNTDNARVFRLNSVLAQETVLVDNAIGTVYTEAQVSLYDNLVNKRFFRLLPGDNEFTVSGNVASLKIRFSNARYLV